MDEVDVVVVGAGYAGLVAARALHRDGLRVAVLEARDRVGGRVLTERTATGHPVELGGQWIGPGQDHVAALAAEHGAATFRAWTAGDGLLVDGGRRERYAGALPPGDPVARAAVALATARLDRMARRVDPERPWSAPGADRLDATTVATWLRRAVPVPRARRLVERVLGEVLATDVDGVSLLALLAHVRSAGGLEPLLAVEGGAQQDLFVDGADGPARAIAAELGDAVRLGTAVSAVHQDRTGVTVSGPGVRVRGERAVVAVPPPLAGRIAYDPPLPALRDQLTQRMPMGSITKIVAVYPEPFWRRDGLSGEGIGLTGPVPAVFDVSRPGGPGHLCVLVAGRAAQRLAELPPARRRSEVLGELARWFGPAAAAPAEWWEKSWADEPHVRGGYSAYSPPGVLTSAGPALRTPVGRIHWAGTETATAWTGYIDGAVQSGHRAAAEVARALHALRSQNAAGGGSGTAFWLRGAV